MNLGYTVCPSLLHWGRRIFQLKFIPHTSKMELTPTKIEQRWYVACLFMVRGSQRHAGRGIRLCAQAGSSGERCGWAEVGGRTGRQPRKRRAWVSGNEQGNAGTVMATEMFLDVDLIQLSGLNGGRLKQNFNLKN